MELKDTERLQTMHCRIKTVATVLFDYGMSNLAAKVRALLEESEPYAWIRPLIEAQQAICDIESSLAISTVLVLDSLFRDLESHSCCIVLATKKLSEGKNQD